MAGACVLLPALAGAQEALPVKLPEGFEARPVDRDLDTPKERADDVQKDALARADVWSPPAVPPSAVDLGLNPGPFPDPAICRFHPSEPSGATPKFDCVFEGGEVLKVKYGKNPEVHSEAAAARLLSALGFGADQIFVLKTLRCFGCRLDPYTAGKNLPVDTRAFVDFHNVAVERRLPGKAIKGKDAEGWGWEELEKAQAEGRGANRAERDALRLDGRAASTTGTTGGRTSGCCACRRAIPRSRAATAARRSRTCTTWAAPWVASAAPSTACAARARTSASSTSRPGARCPSGRTAPRAPSASSRPACTARASATPPSASPAGACWPTCWPQLTPAQMESLFTGALVSDYAGAKPASTDASRWAAVLQDKIRQITEGAPCPTQ